MRYKLIALLLMALVSNSFAAGELWTSDYDSALKKAKKENRHVLLDFTGSDWCGWCIRLNKEVFDTDAFKAYAKDNLVLVEIDFPRKKSLPKDVVARNRKLGEKFEVAGYPTIWILGPDGTPIRSTGYRKGGGEAYVEHLKGLIKAGKKSPN